MNQLRWKAVVLVLLLAIATAVFAFDLTDYLSLDFFKQRQAEFSAYYQAHQLTTLTIFFAIYVLVTALSLPGATVLTLIAGALFGLATALILVSFASSLGATLAFLAARFLLRDTVQNRFGDRLTAINEGIRKDGSFYLFTLRLIPVFPFFIINLVMGLTQINVLRFYWVSQIGMLPGTFVYVNAGTQLGQIESARGILSPSLIVSFVLLGIFPWIARGGLSFWKTRQIFSRFRRPKRFDFNLAVIGAGSAGLISAYIAAAVKARVALIEKHKMGGDCLNTGCVPSKALIRSARFMADARKAQELGFRSAKVDFEFAEVMERVQSIIRRIEPNDSIERYTNLGVDCFEGEARILSPYEIDVGGRRITTKNIVIATGARPFVPPILGLDQMQPLTSENVWNLRVQPKRLLVLGGGAIGCELAQAFQRLGSQVILVERGPRILPREDEDISNLVMARFCDEGMDVRTEHTAARFAHENGEKVVYCHQHRHGGKEVRIAFDEVLVALGRRPNVSGFGLEELKISLTDSGFVEADDFLRTNYPNIYVCGDVTGPFHFTHTAAHQAWYCAVNALFSPIRKFKVDYRVIPWATYTDPEVGRVGLNEQEARERGIPYELTVYEFDHLDRAIADSVDYGRLKVLTPPGKDRILGVTIAGAHAGDLLIEFVTAMKHGIGLNQILSTIHVYPTLVEANKAAAGVWKKAHAPAAALNFLEKFHAWRRG